MAWANTIVISGSLITVLINSTITDERPVSALVKNDLNNAGATISGEQDASVAHALGDRVWSVHIYFGYVLVALLLFRMVLEFFQLADQKDEKCLQAIPICKKGKRTGQT